MKRFSRAIWVRKTLPKTSVAFGVEKQIKKPHETYSKQESMFKDDFEVVWVA